ncbi:hypothetical protein P154DRAFT_530064 [Amniculicola lignicola CBS 123094]|uniref:Uncharacterized protein n=1 Tax=Amniculicola lignicola CBS 123094 TaxID=1392246 RepID=A0A6A5X229_9PLEO|nr:hypothetical protein P154DRAFT_530064 [Amniculicola lignicola CBS 123094]
MGSPSSPAEQSDELSPHQIDDREESTTPGAHSADLSTNDTTAQHSTYANDGLPLDPDAQANLSYEDLQSQPDDESPETVACYENRENTLIKGYTIKDAVAFVRECGFDDVDEDSPLPELKRRLSYVLDEQFAIIVENNIKTLAAAAGNPTQSPGESIDQGKQQLCEGNSPSMTAADEESSSGSSQQENEEKGEAEGGSEGGAKRGSEGGEDNSEKAGEENGEENWEKIGKEDKDESGEDDVEGIGEDDEEEVGGEAGEEIEEEHVEEHGEWDGDDPVDSEIESTSNHPANSSLSDTTLPPTHGQPESTAQDDEGDGEGPFMDAESDPAIDGSVPLQTDEVDISEVPAEEGEDGEEPFFDADPSHEIGSSIPVPAGEVGALKAPSVKSEDNDDNDDHAVHNNAGQSEAERQDATRDPPTRLLRRVRNPARQRLYRNHHGRVAESPRHKRRT